MNKPKLLFSREEMLQLNIKTLKLRGVELDEIAEICYNQQSKYTKDIEFSLCVESVEKILSHRDVFHHVQLGAEIDRITEEKLFRGPIQDILYHDLGLFGIDEVVGLDIAGKYGAIGKTNFGDVDVNKPGVVDRLNEEGKADGKCHTFMDDIVGAIAAAASTRVAQVMNEELAKIDNNVELLTIYDF